MEGLYGTIIFGKAMGRINTFYDIERKYNGRYGTHNVHLRKPLLEWAGNELLEISVRCNLNSTWCGNPNLILAEWHFYNENALAAPLIIGGKPMGPGLSLFVVTDLVERHRHWLKGGQLISVELDIVLREYIPFTEGLLSQFGVTMPFFGAGPLGNISLGAGAI